MDAFRDWKRECEEIEKEMDRRMFMIVAPLEARAAARRRTTLPR
jgi:hypothetical protein